MINLDGQSEKEPSEAHLIDDIDANGFLVDNANSGNESEKENDIDENLGCYENELDADNIVGKVFDTPEDAYTFYNQYAFVHGFGIRIHWDFKNKSTKETYRKLYVCNKEGFKKLKTSSSGGDSTKCRRELRTGCQAKFRITKTIDEKWRVDDFNDTHKISNYNDFRESYKRWVNRDTIEEFEAEWEIMRVNYNLGSSSWMVEMYNQRKHWVKAFFKDIFLAGMTTSQRSESIHSYFDGYVNSKTMLNEFVIQYDKAVNDRRVAEEDEDFQVIRKRLREIVNVTETSCVGISQVDKMPQMSVRDPTVVTNTKG